MRYVTCLLFVLISFCFFPHLFFHIIFSLFFFLPFFSYLSFLISFSLSFFSHLSLSFFSHLFFLSFFPYLFSHIFPNIVLSFVYLFFLPCLVAPLQQASKSVFAVAKYLNSPESVLFRKGSTLFGLDLAKKVISK